MTDHQAALLTDRVLRALGGPFDRPARTMATEMVSGALEEVRKTERARLAGFLDRKAELNAGESARVLRAAAEAMRSNKL